MWTILLGPSASANLKAALAVDNVACGPAIGGIRMAPDVSTEEAFPIAQSHFLPCGREKKEGEDDMKARDVMNKRVTAATPRAIGRDLALQLLSGMYSGLPVVDAKGAVVGVVTEFDLLNAVREGKDLQTVKAEEIMGRPAVCVEEDEPIE